MQSIDTPHQTLKKRSRSIILNSEKDILGLLIFCRRRCSGCTTSALPNRPQTGIEEIEEYEILKKFYVNIVYKF